MALSVEYKSVINDSSWGSLLLLPSSIESSLLPCILDLQQHFVELLDLYEPGLKTSITSLVHVKNSSRTHLVIAYIICQNLSRRGRRLIPQNHKIPTIPWQYIIDDLFPQSVMMKVLKCLENPLQTLHCDLWQWPFSICSYSKLSFVSVSLSDFYFGYNS